MSGCKYQQSINESLTEDNCNVVFVPVLNCWPCMSRGCWTLIQREESFLCNLWNKLNIPTIWLLWIFPNLIYKNRHMCVIYVSRDIWRRCHNSLSRAVYVESWENSANDLWGACLACKTLLWRCELLALLAAQPSQDMVGRRQQLLQCSWAVVRSLMIHLNSVCEVRRQKYSQKSCACSHRDGGEVASQRSDKKA